ncbi:MAG: hypothetical protein SVN78_11020 [Deferribacterota bacterium]|nr:hypothetical protein [Deferribacterota bacterium]
MKKTILFFLLIIFNITISGYATEYGIGGEYLKNSKSITLNKTEKKILSDLQEALIEAKKSNYDPAETIYALDAIEFTAQTVSSTLLLNLVQPFIIALKKAPTNIIERIFPMIQKTVQSSLNNTSINLQKDLIMLKELDFALNNAIYKGYPKQDVIIVLNQLEKIVKQNDTPQGFLTSLINNIIDLFRSIISLPVSFIFQTGIINDTIDIINTTIEDIRNRLERLRNNQSSLINYRGESSFDFKNYNRKEAVK